MLFRSPFWNALFSTGATDTACPIAGDLAFSGGCTDADGREWWGEIAWDDDWGWSSEGFGHDREDGCWEIRSGTTYIEGSAAATSYSFQAGIWTVCEGVVSDGWAADGSATHGFDMDRYDYTWGSNVSLGVRGLGSATLAERDVYVASCAHEPDAGTLTVDADGHTLAYTYDGASACDGAVPVTLDGGDEASASWSTSR